MLGGDLLKQTVTHLTLTAWSKQVLPYACHRTLTNGVNRCSLWHDMLNVILLYFLSPVPQKYLVNSQTNTNPRDFVGLRLEAVDRSAAISVVVEHDLVRCRHRTSFCTQIISRAFTTSITYQQIQCRNLSIPSKCPGCILWCSVFVLSIHLL